MKLKNLERILAAGLFSAAFLFSPKAEAFYKQKINEKFNYFGEGQISSCNYVPEKDKFELVPMTYFPKIHKFESSIMMYDQDKHKSKPEIMIYVSWKKEFQPKPLF